MGNITDLDVTGRLEEKSGSVKGPANEHVVVGILMRLGFECAVYDDPSLRYDAHVEAFNKNPTENPDAEKIPLRVEIETADPNMDLTTGSRGGIDREYKSDVKVIEYTTDHNDLLIGVTDDLNLYLLPTKIAEEFGKSKSVNKLGPLKNKWKLLVNWNEAYIDDLKSELPDFQD